MKRHRMACIKCGETRIRKRRADNEMLFERRRNNIRLCRFGLILIAISLVCAITLFGEENLGAFGMTAGITIGSVFLLGCYLLVFPLVRKELYHYKCSQCSFTWDC
jgi:hypothetical protein